MGETKDRGPSDGLWGTLVVGLIFGGIGVMLLLADDLGVLPYVVLGAAGLVTYVGSTGLAVMYGMNAAKRSP